MNAEELEKLNEFMRYEEIRTVDDLIKTYRTLLNFAVYTQYQIKLLDDKGVLQ